MEDGEIMKKLNELYDCSYDCLVKDIKTNSKDIEEGDMFVCIKGVKEDRHNYILEAIKKGCSCLIVERGSNYSVPFIKVKDTNKELGNVSKKFYDYDDSLKMIGVTGTDGKTTTSLIIRDMLGECGYIGTNGIKSNKNNLATNNTTPELNLIYKYLAMFKEERLKYVSMETSSEGLLHNRVYGINYDIGVLTNISEDHLNVHKTLSNYIASKIKLFKNIKEEGYAILNKDDRFYDKFKENCHCHVFSYGKDKNSDIIINRFVEKDTGTDIDFVYKNNLYSVESNLKGEYNVYNLIAGISVLICLGFEIEDIIERVKQVEQVAGRCEIFEVKNFKVVLDYAHTENGLRSILNYLNKIKKNRIITVTGSAGGREKEKRKGMGKVVQELSDLVIYTMDDPRYEKVRDIIDEMKVEDKDNYIIIENREEAIKKAFSLAEENDIILVAGKGRDNYMAIEDKHIEYSDFEVISNLISNSNFT